MIENKKYYVYHIIDDKNNIPFYIGKGSGTRLFEHQRVVRKGKIPNLNPYTGKGNVLLWWKLKHCKPVYEKVFETNDEKEAYQREIEEIDFYGFENLTNKSFGGKGGNHLFGEKNPMKRPENKRKISDTAKIRYQNKENHPNYGKIGYWAGKKRPNLSERMRGEKHPMYGVHRYGKDAPNYGKRWTDKQKKKQSELMKQIMKRPEIQAKLRSPDVKARLKSRMIADNPMKRTEVRAKLSATWKEKIDMVTIIEDLKIENEQLKNEILELEKRIKGELK